MSEETVETFKRAVAAGNRRDLDAMLEAVHPEVEWHPALPALRGEEPAAHDAVYRGREGAREALQDLLDAFAEFHFELSETRDLGDQVLGIGLLHVRGVESGIEMESPFAYLVRFKNGKAIWIRTYTDSEEALEAAGVSE